MSEKRLLVAGLQLRGRGGLAVRPHDISMLRQVLGSTPGAQEIQLLEDQRDVDVTLALGAHSAQEGLCALIPGLTAVFGHSAWPGLTTVKFQLWEVP